MKTNLYEIREYTPCVVEWAKLLKYLGKTKPDAEPLSLLTILDATCYEHALWCTRAVEGYDKELRLFAVWCAREVQDLMTDVRSVTALDVAERYANGLATENELRAAHDRADDAAAHVADNADAAAHAADAASYAAYYGADAARAAGAAANAAAYAAFAAACDAYAYTNAIQKQEAKFREMLEEIEKC